MHQTSLLSTTGERLDDLAFVASHRTYEIATASRANGGRAAVKSVRAHEFECTPEFVARELAALQIDCQTLPAGAAGFDTDGPRGRERLVTYDWIDGETLADRVRTRSTTGLPVDQLMRILQDLSVALGALHSAGYVHRCLSPDHVIIRPDGRATLIGLANLVERGARPPDEKETTDPVFTAPEVRDEASGRFNVPRADVYSFGLLAAFAATGIFPTGSVNAPLTREAIQRIEAGDQGIALLIARCLQPLQKNRIGSMRQISPMLEDAESLPSETTPGFGPLTLVAPWLDDGPGAGRVGHLSPGPLVDRPRQAKPPRNGTTSHSPIESVPPAATDLPARWFVSALVIALASWIAAKTWFSL